MSKTAIKPKSAKQILDARIAEAYVQDPSHVNLYVIIPMWVAEELKQALEKQ